MAQLQLASPDRDDIEGLGDVLSSQPPPCVLPALVWTYLVNLESRRADTCTLLHEVQRNRCGAI